MLMLGTHTWYKSWLGLCGFDKSNLVPTSVSVGLVRLSSDRHDLIPPPLATITKFTIRMNKLILILLFGLICRITIGQELDSLRFAYCEYDSINAFDFFPVDVLVGDFDIIITGNHKGKKEQLEIGWFSSCIDGTYSLIVTPRQMYLRSHHCNPNPNYLYWLENSDSRKYKLIKEYLNKSKDFKYCNAQYRNDYIYSFENYLEEEYVNEEWEDKMYENLNILIAEINEAIKLTGEEIKIPSKKYLMNNHVRLLVDKEEVNSQINILNLEQVSDSLIFLED